MTPPPLSWGRSPRAEAWARVLPGEPSGNHDGQPGPTHREVPDPQGVLQQALEGHGPAGGPPLTQAPAALCAREAGVAAQAVAAHAVLQVSAVQLCGDSTDVTCVHVRHPAAPPSPAGGGGALPSHLRTCVQLTSCTGHLQHAPCRPRYGGQSTGQDQPQPQVATRTHCRNPHGKAARHKSTLSEGGDAAGSVHGGHLRGPAVRQAGAGHRGACRVKGCFLGTSPPVPTGHCTRAAHSH